MSCIVIEPPSQFANRANPCGWAKPAGFWVHRMKRKYKAIIINRQQTNTQNEKLRCVGGRQHLCSVLPSIWFKMPAPPAEQRTTISVFPLISNFCVRVHRKWNNITLYALVMLSARRECLGVALSLSHSLQPYALVWFVERWSIFPCTCQAKSIIFIIMCFCVC